MARRLPSLTLTLDITCLVRFFRHSRLSSFHRQLSIYEFKRIACGQDKNAYYHPYFIRDRPELIFQIQRIATKSNDSRHRTNDCIDPPNFYIEETSSRDISNSTIVPEPHSNNVTITNSTENVSSVTLLEQILSSIPQHTSVINLLLRLHIHSIISGNVQQLHADVVNQLSNISTRNTSRMLDPTTFSMPAPSNQINTNMDQLSSSDLPLHTQVLSRLILNQLSPSSIGTPYQDVATLLPLVTNTAEAIRSGALDAIVGVGINQQQQHYANDYGNIVHNNNNNTNRSNTRDILTTLGSDQNNMQSTNGSNNHTSSMERTLIMFNNVQNQNVMSDILNHSNWIDAIQNNRMVIPTMNLHNPVLPTTQLLPISERNMIQRRTENAHADEKQNDYTRLTYQS
jgi:hypothetical protein